jgi:hypothetical protein
MADNSSGSELQQPGKRKAVLLKAYSPLRKFTAIVAGMKSFERGYPPNILFKQRTYMDLWPSEEMKM